MSQNVVKSVNIGKSRKNVEYFCVQYSTLSVKRFCYYLTKNMRNINKGNINKFSLMKRAQN